MKKYQKILVLAVVLLISILLFVDCKGSGQSETKASQKGLPAYLLTALPDSPYACAEISVKAVTSEMGGSTNISWKTFETAQELQEYIISREKKGEQAEWTYYQCKLQDDFHALDLYYDLKCYDTAENPICAVTCAKGLFYRFSQQMERELIIRDDYIYGLVYSESAPGSTPSDVVQTLLNAFVQQSQKWEKDYLAGEILDEEDLYWLDHEDRKTTLENPRRTFTEMRAVDADWENEGVKTRKFGMLQCAEYEIAFPGREAGLCISFHYAKEVPVTGYETYLADYVCSDETYVMRVTDLQTGRLIQIADVTLCIDSIDTVSFVDKNRDGFPDLKIERPVHFRDSAEDRKAYENASYILWIPDEGKFDVGLNRQAQRETCMFKPVRVLPVHADRADYCVLTDEEGEVYLLKDKQDIQDMKDKGGAYVAHPEAANVYRLSGDMGYISGDKTYIDVRTNLTVNKMGENALTQDWENFVSEVTRCSELCKGRAYNLNFEKYHLEGGSDLYGYTFDFDAYDKIYEAAVFIRLEKVNMLEAIGIREKADNDILKDVTRYIGASFIDFGGDVFDGYCRMSDNAGADEWDYPELHNMFSTLMDMFYTYAERPDENFPNDHAVSFTEPQLEHIIRSALEELWQLDEGERAAFESRPLMMSDLAVITDLECVRTKDVPSVLRVRINQYEQEIEMTERISYEDLANLSGLKKLEMNVFDLTDFRFVGELTSLRELILSTWYEVDNVDFLGNLEALRTLALLSSNPAADYPGPAGFSNITDLSALGNCRHLAYLYLITPSVTDFSFLENTPEIYTIVLQGEEGAVPDRELLPNAMYINFY